MGKRILPGRDRQHFTHSDYLEHEGVWKPRDQFLTTSVDYYRGIAPDEPTKHRRFPRAHESGTCRNTNLSTGSHNWLHSPEVPYKLPTQMLASSQEPFLKPNKWKYSNHSTPKCYPHYDKVKKSDPYPSWIVHGLPDVKV